MKQTYEQEFREASQMAVTICQLPRPVKDRLRYIIDGAGLVCEARKEEDSGPERDQETDEPKAG